MYSGPQCETDLINECTPDTCSAQGMCQDRAEKDPVCLCPIVGEYSQPKLVFSYNLIYSFKNHNIHMMNNFTSDIYIHFCLCN